MNFFVPYLRIMGFRSTPLPDHLQNAQRETRVRSASIEEGYPSQGHLEIVAYRANREEKNLGERIKSQSNKRREEKSPHRLEISSGTFGSLFTMSSAYHADAASTLSSTVWRYGPPSPDSILTSFPFSRLSSLTVRQELYLSLS